MTVDDLREKVINEPVECIESALAVDSDYVDCVRTDLLQTVVGLLKAQEPQTVIVDDIPKDDTWFGIWFGRCPNCKEMLTKKYHKHFFGNCGQAVKWYD